MTNSLTLSELTLIVRSAIYGNFPDSLWVVAEILELHENKTGHCYLELAEKDSSGERITARMRAMIWASVYRNIKPFFEKTTGLRLSAGIKVMFLVQVEFHEVYGLGLNIRDIDPSYTLGEIALRKQEVVNKLKEKGVFDMNSLIEFPLVPQRIAIISSETAAGYGDFMHALNSNPCRIKYSTKLFPAIMQGEKSETSIISSLERVFKNEKDFDIVVLIRGGGAQSELECFNNYKLAFHITQFPLPVVTGIGHERDNTVTDLVANLSLKTPTAVAEFINSRNAEFLELLAKYNNQIVSAVSGVIILSNNYLNKISWELSRGLMTIVNEEYIFLRMLNKSINTNVSFFTQIRAEMLNRFNNTLHLNVSGYISREMYKLKNTFDIILKSSAGFLQNKKTDLDNLQKNMGYLDPVRILKRGFTITCLDGQIIKDPSILCEGELLDTVFYNGKISSRVEKTQMEISKLICNENKSPLG